MSAGAGAGGSSGGNADNGIGTGDGHCGFGVIVIPVSHSQKEKINITGWQQSGCPWLLFISPYKTALLGCECNCTAQFEIEFSALQNEFVVSSAIGSCHPVLWGSRHWWPVLFQRSWGLPDQQFTWISLIPHGLWEQLYPLSRLFFCGCDKTF